ncbi:circularly permuted type 2 ATP-grasp protein [Pelagovum pacificum]|uniref:Uncharacterized protein n=1 Tax=Pelagovum pacificum TaxID=2588711 RepID=A0A5C5GAI0_9RHOB|nr:circularly permuted type 2 ATP-grasp protein [Pelagovum pacificum]QQA41693.1 circularly permuted type 2 ATP-grasp protein [Pelagovum pacificum]TNY30970.1 hypothetical protein FHY64_17900 [Pelagovum pacificum]
MSETVRTGTREDLGRLMADYRVEPGVADELLDTSGNIRPVWRPFLEELATLSPEQLDRNIAKGQQYLRDAGVYFRHYGEESGAERDWPLGSLPLLIGNDEWQQIGAALIERADLLERVAADIYGPNDLVAQGLLPPELVMGNSEWLRPLVGIRPQSGNFLHFVAFDIGRGPDGNWWVLGDRMQAPSGAGFALETRMATVRSFADTKARANVQRLASFFRAFRDALNGLRGPDRSRAAILTPGPLNDTYFEHAYIARYLGMMLVEGEDLTVQNGQLLVRTASGLQPISVLWRRLDSQWADPLELNSASRIGTPGMVSALRGGSVTMINALGTGALEARALMAFIPRIARHLNGHPLAMPNIATWWCGSQAERDYVKENLHRMTIDQALSTRLPFDHGEDVVIGGRTVTGGKVNPAWIDQMGKSLAAQEIVSLSTAPALEDGRLVSRPMSLRVFLARTPQGWIVAPGGFARIGHAGQGTSISVQRGGSVCDVWVMGDRPVEEDTLLRTEGSAKRRRFSNSLPTRAADNLFWLGRYIERAEQKVRMVRSYHLRLAEQGDAKLPLTTYFRKYLKGLGLKPDEPLPASLINDIRAAKTSAGRIQDRFSVDGWSALVDLLDTAEALAGSASPGDDAVRAQNQLLRKLSGFSGLIHENMYRFIGWRFLSIGRSMERAWATANSVVALTGPKAPDGSYEIAIEAGDSVMTHRRRYVVSDSRETVIDLLMLDAMNPRSVLYQLSEIHAHLKYLPIPAGGGEMTPLRREVMKLETRLAVAEPPDLDQAALEEIANQVAGLSGLLAQTHLR